MAWPSAVLFWLPLGIENSVTEAALSQTGSRVLLVQDTFDPLTDEVEPYAGERLEWFNPATNNLIQEFNKE